MPHNIRCINAYCIDGQWHNCPVWTGFEKCGLGIPPHKCGLEPEQMIEITKAASKKGRLVCVPYHGGGLCLPKVQEVMDA